MKEKEHLRASVCERLKEIEHDIDHEISWFSPRHKYSEYYSKTAPTRTKILSDKIREIKDILGCL